MEVRHNTSLLEEAVAHVVRRAAIPTLEAEAEAIQKQSRAASYRRLATGGAIALASVGLGLGIHLGLIEPLSGEVATAGKQGTSATSSPSLDDGGTTAPLPRPAPDPAPNSDVQALPSPKPDTSPRPPLPPDTITTDFSKFNTRNTQLLSQTWEIKAGHFFAKESDTAWQSAWCYTTRVVGGITINVDLATRATPASPPIAPLASRETLSRVGLTAAAAVALATKCPWLDRKSFLVTEHLPPTGTKNPFRRGEPILQVVGRTLTYSGDIGSDFSELLRQRDFDHLRIESLGGLVVAAIEAGLWLRQEGKTVEVSTECLSACVLVLAGGVNRSALPDARIGVHRFYGLETADARTAVEIAQQLSSEILRYLSQMGVNSDLFVEMASVPSETIKYISHERLQEWRLLSPAQTEKVTGPAPSSPVEAGSEMVEKDGFDALGHDLAGMPMRNVTLEQCRQGCSSTPECEAITYNKKAQACFLKDNATTVVQDEKAHLEYRKRVASNIVLSPLVFFQNTELYGQILGKIVSIKYVDCIQLCNDDHKCEGFNYDSKRTLCKRLQSILGQGANSEWVAGRKSKAQ